MAQSWAKRAKSFLGSAKGLVLTIGALASAVAAVIALIPKHPPSPVFAAHFSGVTAYPYVSLDQYDARAASEAGAIEGSPGSSKQTGEVSSRVFADTTPPRDATLTSGEASEPGTSGEDQETTSTATTPSPSPSPTPTTTTTQEVSPPAPQITPPATAFRHIEGARVTSGTGAPKAKVDEVLDALATSSAARVAVRVTPGSEPSSTTRASTTASTTATPPPPPPPPSTKARVAGVEIVLPNKCRSATCGATSEIDDVLTDNSDPVAAAQAVAAIFANSRGKLVHHKLYPVGVAVSYTLELDGFAGKEATLKWSLWSRDTEQALPNSWLRDVPVAVIKPEVDDETVSGQFWVPIPPRRGEYFVHVTVYDKRGVAHASSDATPLFH